MDIDTISVLTNKCLEANNLNDCYLVDLKINNKKVEVFLDSDDRVTFQKCKIVSRCLEEVFDEKKWFGEKYILEVSSAGVGKPLKFARQYKKNIGRKIEVVDHLQEKYKGILSSADDQEIEIEWEKKVKEGKKKKIKKFNKRLSYDDIKVAKIKVSF